MTKLTLPQRKAIAIARYDEAMADPAATLERWRTVATMLRAFVTTRTGTAAPPAPVDDGGGYAPWHDDRRPHKLRKGNGKRAIAVEFTDGRSTLASASDYGNFNIGRAVRVACTMYRHQVRKAVHAYGPHAPEFWSPDPDPIWGVHCPRLPWAGDCYVEHIPVAEILSVRCETTGEAWDPAVANAETAEYRAAGMSLADRAARQDSGREIYKAAVWAAIWARQPEREIHVATAKPQARPSSPLARRLLGSVAVLPSWPRMAVYVPVQARI